MKNISRKTYTVGGLAKLAGISVRTLQYYDTIGLLTPTERTAAGYRVYRDSDLLKLQQIMFYRELEIPLKNIAAIVNDQDFDTAAALEKHREMLIERQRRTGTLIHTIDRTIQSLKGDTMLTDEELYEGFSKEEIAQLKEYEREADLKYDPEMVAESRKRVRSMSKEQWNNIRREGDEITLQLATLMDRDPASREVQDAIARHYAHLHHFYTPNLEMYRGLGEMYVADSRFRAYYDKYAKGLADFIRKAIDVFCGNAEAAV